MRRLNIMVGVPASGKDTYIKKHVVDGDIIVSSDDIRESMYGDASIQGDANKVFAKVHEFLTNAMSEGKEEIWYNATNVTIKSRARALELAKKYGYDVVCFVMATPIHTCIERDLKRDRHVTEEVIRKFVYRFQFPVEKEIDKVVIVRQDISDVDTINLELILDSMKGFSQNSKYHKEDLYTHSANVGKMFLNTIYDTIGSKDLATTLYTYALLHDYGKLFTRTESIKDGEITYHFYQHENVGAYLLLTEFCAPHNTADEMLIEGIRLVNYHMLIHNGVSEKKLSHMNDFTVELIRKFSIIDSLASEREE